MKNTTKSIRFHSLIAITLMVASCTSTIDPKYAITKDEFKTMRQRQAAHTTDGALKGAAVGSILGAGMTALNGGSQKDIQKAAITGGIAGGLAGGFAGFKKGDNKGKEIVRNKRSTKSIQADIADRTQKARESSAQAQQWLNRMRAQVSAGELTGNALKNLKEEATEAIEDSIKNLELTPELKGGPGAAGLQSQINTLKNYSQQISKLSAEGAVQKVS
jgi:outer membrane lipoprotein SlyB